MGRWRIAGRQRCQYLVLMFDTRARSVNNTTRRGMNNAPGKKTDDYETSPNMDLFPAG